MTSSVLITGWLHGLPSLSLNGAGLCNELVNGTGISIQNTVKRLGDYALHVSATTTTTYVGYTTGIAGNAVVVAHMYFRLASYHSTSDSVIWFPTALNKIAFGIEAASPHRIYIYHNGNGLFYYGNVNISLDTWYCVDIRVDVSANPNLIDWQVYQEGGSPSAQTQVSAAVAATTISAVRVGNNNVSTCDFYATDLIVSVTGADYPIATNARVGLLYPNGAGTSVPGTIIQDNGSVVVNDSTNPANVELDDVPMGSTAEYIKQTGTGASNYAEVTFSDLTDANTVLGAMAILAYHSAATQANAAQTRIRDGAGQETTVYSGDMSESSLFYKSKIITPPVAGWSQTTVNALLGRVGYASDANPNPYWDALLIEVAYVPITGTTYDDALTLARSAAITESMVPDLAGALTLSRSAAVAENVLGDYGAGLTLAKGLGITPTNVNDMTATLTLVKTLATTLAGGMVYDSSLTLAKAHALVTTYNLTIEKALTLTRTAAIVEAAIQTFESALTLARSAAITEGGSLDINALLTLARATTITEGGVLDLQLVLGLARALSIAEVSEIVAGGTTYEDALSLSKSLAMVLNAIGTFDRDVTLSRSASITEVGSLDLTSVATLAKTLSVSEANTLDLVMATTLAKALSVSEVGSFDLDFSVALAKALGIVEDATITTGAQTYNEALTLVRTMGLSNIGTAELFAALSLPKGVSVTSSGLFVFDSSVQLSRSDQMTETVLASLEASLSLTRSLSVLTNNTANLLAALVLQRSSIIQAAGGSEYEALLTLLKGLQLSPIGEKQAVRVLRIIARLRSTAFKAMIRPTLFKVEVDVNKRRLTIEPFDVGATEQFVFEVDFTKWGIPSSPTTTVLDIRTGVDMSATMLVGSASVGGNVVSTPTILGFEEDHDYIVTVGANINGLPRTAYINLSCR